MSDPSDAFDGRHAADAHEWDWLCELHPDFNKPGLGPAAEWDGNGDVGLPPTAEEIEAQFRLPARELRRPA